MKRVSVSVLIPFYNRTAHIQMVVQRILDQSYPPYEVIVVNDASTQNCREVLETLPVKVIHHDRNQGPAIARNTAFAASSGEIVIFIDSDAYADPHMIEALLRVYHEDQNPSLGGVGGRGIEICKESIYDAWRMIHGRQDFGPVRRKQVPYLYGLCCSFPRSVLERVKGFDPYFPINAGEDLDLGYRLRNQGYYLVYTPDAYVHHMHKDTRESLFRVQYNWVYWNCVVRRRNGIPLETIYFGVYRRLLYETLSDLFFRHSFALARLDIALFFNKIKALRDFRQVESERKR